ncbi:MAG: AAA family ATPase [Clostridiales bacterium]|nr:AAA family ATPase [Clostridiales bacterium]
MNIKSFLSRLDGVKQVNGQWQAKCPAHDDSRPSLSVAEDDGKILIHCHAGCSHSEILRAMRIDETELFEDDNTLDDLSKDINYNSPNKKINRSKKNKWKKLDLNDIEAKPIPEDSQAMDYLNKRGFSTSTVRYFDLMVNKEGNIVFPYYDPDGQLTFLKYRPPHKITSDYDGPKSWREKNTKPIFWNEDKIDINEPLVITEGEMDNLALYEAGVENVTSVPSGASDLTVLETSYDWIDQFNQIIIWPDQDEKGLKLLDNLATRLGKWRCRVVQSDYKDANVHLYKEGEESVCKAIDKAEDMAGGIVRVSEVDDYDPRDEERIQSTLPLINEVTGGFGFGEVSIWTGKSGHGKSTFILNEIASALDQDYPVLLYNGEYTDSKIRYWTELILAGDTNVGIDDSGKRDIPFVKSSVRGHIREWYADSYFLYDTTQGDNIKELLETFKYAVGRYGCKLFIVDNLMKAVFASRSSGNWDRYQLQSELVGMLVDFAKSFDVHVMLVAHPKKTDGKIDDLRGISGHADITNRTDLVFSVKKIEEEEISKDKTLEYADRKNGIPRDKGVVRILKNRPIGPTGHRIILKFDEKTKRFAQRGAERENSLNRVYQWKDSF